MLWTILIWIVVGIVAGWLTGLVVKGRGFGLLGDLVVGLLGGVVGGLVFGQFGLAPTNWLGQVFVSLIGGIILVGLIRLLRRV